MSDGELGKEVEPGKWEKNDIPGAKNDSVAYDDAYFNLTCRPFGDPTITGPNGVVTTFQADNQAPTTATEYGKAEVFHDGDTICIVIPVTKVVTQTGTTIVYDWYDASCLLSSAVLLKEKSRSQTPQVRKTILKPLKRCETDIPAWLFHKLTGLISSGASPTEIVKLLTGYLASSGLSPGSAGGELASAAGDAEHRLVAEPKKPVG